MLTDIARAQVSRALLDRDRGHAVVGHQRHPRLARRLERNRVRRRFRPAVVRDRA